MKKFIFCLAEEKHNFDEKKDISTIFACKI